MEEQPHEETLDVLNPGFDRTCAMSWPFAHRLSPTYGLPEHGTAGTQSVPMPDPWTRLLWWESQWQAEIGIKDLCAQPYIDLQNLPGMGYGDEIAVPTRAWYPYALCSSQTDRIKTAARTISALARQARELYAAAAASDVTDVSKPILYFYGAEALAQAVIISLFGVERFESRHAREHGLNCPREHGVTTRHPDGVKWPTTIEWKPKGIFAMFYRATRWDRLYDCCSTHSAWKSITSTVTPEFHVLECIRWLGLDWGTLPATGFEIEQPYQAVPASRLEPLLMVYRPGGHLFLSIHTPRPFPSVNVPRAIVQYMLLFYFSILARYHTVIWQELLAGVEEPEGFVFRVAFEQVALDFLNEMTSLLPRPFPDGRTRPIAWYTGSKEELLRDWYRPDKILVGGPHLPPMKWYYWQEWQGEPSVTCPERQR